MGLLEAITQPSANIYKPGTSFAGANTDDVDNDIQKRYAEAVAGTVHNMVTSEPGLGYNLTPLGDADKYTDVGLQRSVGLLKAQREGELEKVLADSQSNWQKTRNALAQTLINEVGLGTLKGFSDLFDFSIMGLINKIAGNEQDYQNPVSAFIENLQKDFEEYAPIYSDPTRNSIADGGLTNWGYYMSNLPSIASSLTLLIPGEGAVMGLSKLSKLGKVGKLGKGVKKAINLGRRAAGGIENAERIKQGIKLGVSAGVSRITENYQEANQVYQDMYKDATDTLKGMSDEEYNGWIERNKGKFDENFDFSNKDAVAKNIAKQSADETFRDDMWNAIFDVYELYALKNLTRVANAPMRSSVRRKHLDSMKYIGKTNDEIKNIKNARKWYEKVGEKVSDYTYGMKTAISAELSEGVEEAVNYISQQEGMHLGNVILEKENPTPVMQRFIDNYAKAPELYDSAFWGVLGGVVFQGLGSQFEKLKNTIEIQTDDRYKKNDKTDEQIPKPSILESWSIPEVKMRNANIEKRSEIVNNALSTIQSIKDGTYKDSNGNTPTTESEKEVARRNVFNDMITDILIQSQDAGNYDLATEFLTNDNVIKFLVDNGITTEENARETKEAIQGKIDKLNYLYNKNFSAIDNALRGVDKISGIDLEDMPIEYLKIVARENTKSELKSEEYATRADEVEKEISRLEEQHKDDIAGKNYRKQIEHVVATASYLDAVQHLEKLENSDANKNTLLRQRLIKEQKKKIKTLEDYITRNITGDDTDIDMMSRFLSSYQQGRNFLLSKESDPARRKEISDRYKKFDEAILTKNIDFFKGLSTVFNTLDTHADPMIALESAIHQASVLNQNIERNLKDNRTFYTEVSEFSKDLANAYARAADLRLASIWHSTAVNTKKSDILDSIDALHNVFLSARYMAIENANDKILRLAKKYGSENILSYIDNRLRNNDGTGLTDDDDKLLFDRSSDKIQGITNEHKRTLDDSLEILHLTSAPNINVIEQIRKNLEEAAAKDYAEIGELDEIYKQATEENSTGNENPQESAIKQDADKSSSEPPKDENDANVSEIGTFKVDKNNKSLPRPMARVNVTDDGKITLTQIDASNPLDNDVPIIEGEDGVIEIDLKTLFEENPSHPIFQNDKLVNLDGNTTLDDDIEVVSNPQGIIDDDGNFTVANKGQVRKQGEEEKEVSNVEFGNALKAEANIDGERLQHYLDELNNNKSIEDIINDIDDSNPDKDYLQDLYDRLKRGEKPVEKPTISSTGGQELSPASTSNEDRAAEQEFNGVNVKGEIQLIIGKYINDNPVYNEEEILELAKAQLENVPEDDIREQIIALRNWAKRRATAKGYDKVLAALDDLTMASDILDKEIKLGNSTDTAKNLLDDAFKRILEEYAKHCALDTYKGVTYINLTNLLSYLNSATDNEYTAEVVFQNILKVINQKNSGYRILDNNYTENEYIARAKMSTDELSEVVANDSIQRINLASFLNYLKDTIEDEFEYEQERDRILEAVENAKVGDKLEYGITDKGRIVLTLNGTAIGSMPVPIINKEGTHYTMINEGWKTDVPFNGESSSEFYSMLEAIFVNPDNADIADSIRKASHTNQNSTEFKQAADYIIGMIKNIDGINAEALMSDTNNAGKEQYSNTDRLKHLIKLYNYVKSISDKRAVSSKENLDNNPIMRELQGLSLNNWISKLKNSYDALRALATDPNLDIEIATITEGGVISTEDYHPVSEAIGEKHKGKIQLAISSVTQPGVLHVSGSSVESDPGIFPGRSRIIINSRESWKVQAIPAKFSSDNFKNNEAGKIVNEIINEFDKILNKWGENPKHTNLDELESFIKEIASRSNANQPFVYGIRITNKSDDNHINLECTTDDGTFYINFWNKRRTNNEQLETASNVEIKGRNNETILKGTSYLYTREGAKKDDVRKQVLDLLKKSMHFNMNPNYVISDNNKTLPLQGVARRNKEGKFVVKIGNNEEHIFDSYSDFVIGQNVVNVKTMHNEEGSNIISTSDGGNITFKINSKKSTPVEESKQTKTSDTPIRNLGDETLKLLESGKQDVGIEILKLVLNDTQLNNLKNSKILGQIIPKNIIFVKGYNHIAAYEPVAKEINGVNVPAGYVVISDDFIDLLNSKSETAADDHMQAVRHLIHEGIHDLLTKDENKKAVEAIREIFDKFVEANQSLPENEGVRLFEFRYSDNAKNRYYTDGKINLKGLEEFLVESLTRPVLMQRLNEIGQNGRKVGSERDIKSTRGNLFQRILSALADLLGVKINKNSLLSKEYEIFRDLFKNKKETTKEEYEQLKLNFEESTKTEKTVKTEEVVTKEDTSNVNEDSNENDVTNEEKNDNEEENNDDGDDGFNFGEDESFSDISDEFVSSETIANKLLIDDANAFKNMLNNGLIQIYCK